MPQEPLTAAETARETGSPLHYIYELLWSGRLAGKKVQGVWRVDAKAVAALMKKRRKKMGSSRNFPETESSTRAEQQPQNSP
jgi:hypothetical protein